MNKRLLLFVVTVLTIVGAKADEVAFSVPDFSIEPGETKEISLVMTSTSADMKFNFNGEMILSEGLTFVSSQVWDEDNEEYVTAYALRTDRLKAKHTISENLKAPNDLSFVVSAGTSYLSYRTGDAVITFKVKAADDMPLGTASVSLKDMSASGEAAVELVAEPDYTATVTVTKKFAISVVSADENKGSVAGAGDYTAGTKATVTATPNPGYNFVNWTSGESVLSTTNPYEFTVTEAKSLTANFAAIIYDITYDLADGTLGEATNPASYTVETEDFTLNNPTKEGYTFIGWLKEGEETPKTEVTIAKGSVTGNLKYTAQWTVNNYQLKFMVDGEAIVNESVAFGTAIVKPTDPTKTGYTFAGWNPAVDATMPAKDVTYTAMWMPTVYQLSYIVTEGQVGTTDIWKVGAETAITAAQTYVDNDIVKVATTFASTKNASTPTIDGEEFTHYIQVRANEYPTTAVPDGTEKSGSTTLVITPKQNMVFTIYYRRQPGSNAYLSNDGKDLIAFDRSDASQIPAVLGLSSTISDGAYGYVFKQFVLEADKSYTLAAKGTTIQLFGFSYSTENVKYYTIESEDFKLKNPTRDYYDFAGWKIGEEEPNTDVTITKGCTGDRSYTATWTPTVYTISYNLDGGTLAQGDTNPATYTIESAAITLKDPTKEGYTFAGWTGTGLTEASKSVTISAGSTGDLSYTATWTVNQYTITFDSDGGTSVADIVDNYGATLTAPAAPTKEGYTFKGWTPAFPETMPLNGASLKATWEAVTYNISYVLDGGTLAQGDTNPATYTVESEAITLKNPTKEGYTFAGWTGTDLTQATTPVTIAAGSTGDRSYTATWTVNQYTITFDSDGGTSVADIVDNYGATLTAPAAPTKEGYTFKGWTPAFPETMPLNGASLKATWEAVTYNISYNLDGGTLAQGDTNPATYTIESAAITLKNPTKEGYTFAGWTGTDLTEATTPVTIAAGSTGDRSYTATWTVNQYTITFDSDGGTSVADIVENYGATLTAPAAPTKEGYTFKGWTPDFPETMPLNGASLKATWEAVTYNISYNLDGGTLAQGDTNPATYTVESEAITLKNPTKEGYTFAGWTGTDLTQATTPVTIAAGSTGDRSYTATWTVNTGITQLFVNSKTVDVYTINGTLVGRKMTVDEVQHLPKGLYIIYGKKMVVK